MNEWSPVDCEDRVDPATRHIKVGDLAQSARSLLQHIDLWYVMKLGIRCGQLRFKMTMGFLRRSQAT